MKNAWPPHGIVMVSAREKRHSRLQLLTDETLTDDLFFEGYYIHTNTATHALEYKRLGSGHAPKLPSALIVGATTPLYLGPKYREKFTRRPASDEPANSDRTGLDPR